MLRDRLFQPVAAARTISYMCPSHAPSLPQPTGLALTHAPPPPARSAHARTRADGAYWPAAEDVCTFWPARAVERYAGPFDRVLVLGNTVRARPSARLPFFPPLRAARRTGAHARLRFDPATPSRRARRAADALGDRAALVRLNGFGVSTRRLSGL